MSPHPILPIEDYALISNMHTAALVGRNGSIDWLCLPRFDSPACFAALLGRIDNGRWLICPQGEVRAARQTYRGDTLVVETRFATDSGSASVLDFMPLVPSGSDNDCLDLVRLVVGNEGCVPMQTDLVLRFDYGRIKPWVRRTDTGIAAIAGPDAVQVTTPVGLKGEDFHTRGTFDVAAGQTVPFTMSWHPSHRPGRPLGDPQKQLAELERWWTEWANRCPYQGPWRDPVVRSLLTLKALTYEPTGGIVAAPTTSLPESFGGIRNWDYRYCWLRDATLTLYALLTSGYAEEAAAWREWLLRAVAGDPRELQIMYGLAGEHRLAEFELPWLSGYLNSRPVRIGNAAHAQKQIDVYGEVMDAFHLARRHGLDPSDDAWRVQKVLLDFLETQWSEPDEGIWEVRGPRRHFTHSKVMAWCALDRSVKSAEACSLECPIDRWRMLRDKIHADVCQRGFDADRGSFMQSYGSNRVDAALLMIPLVGFLPPEDRRVLGTIAAIERELMRDGLLMRYLRDPDVDGLPSEEGAFLACSFWLADALHMTGRTADATALFERLLSLCNHVGLLAEEYDTVAGRQCGNFPQAFSHIGIVNTAHNLTPRETGPARRTAAGEPHRAARNAAQPAR
jgi:GH15 family glucan-1,4-alpha-glucosidase